MAAVPLIPHLSAPQATESGGPGDAAVNGTPASPAAPPTADGTTEVTAEVTPEVDRLRGGSWSGLAGLAKTGFYHWF